MPPKKKELPRKSAMKKKELPRKSAMKKQQRPLPLVITLPSPDEICMQNAMRGHEPSIQHFGILRVVKSKVTYKRALSYDEKKIWIRWMVDTYLYPEPPEPEQWNDDFLLSDYSDSEEVKEKALIEKQKYDYLRNSIWFG